MNSFSSPLNIMYLDQLMTVYGGDYKTVEGIIENRANNTIDTVLVISISAPSEFTDDVVEFAGSDGVNTGYYDSDYVGYLSFKSTGGERIYLPLGQPEMNGTDFPSGENVAMAYTPVLTLDAEEQIEFTVDFIAHPEIEPGSYMLNMQCVSPEHVMRQVNIVHKSGEPDWNVIPSEENGVLTYCIDRNGILTYSYDNPIPGYELVVVMAETEDHGDWPQTGSMALEGTSGVADISSLLGYVDDGADYDGEVYGAKIWYVPEGYFSEESSSFTTWNPEEMLFEEDLIVGNYLCVK